ncbi:MAG: DUF2064 domain-containing protein [Pseudomonadota bacterium]
MESLVVVACAPGLEALTARLQVRFEAADAAAASLAFVDAAAALARGFKQSTVPSDGNRKVVLLVRPGQGDESLARVLEGVPARTVEVPADQVDAAVAEAVRHEVDRGARSVVVASVLAPTLPPYLLDHAFRALLFHDLVVGPDFAGHTYLLGVRRPPPSFALDLHWDPTPAVSTVLDAAARGTNMTMLPFWYQLGDDASLAWLETHLRVLRGRPWLLASALPDLVERANRSESPLAP